MQRLNEPQRIALNIHLLIGNGLSIAIRAGDIESELARALHLLFVYQSHVDFDGSAQIGGAV